MIENLRKKGQPVTKELQDMADWLDGLEASANEAEVRACKLVSSNVTASDVLLSGSVMLACTRALWKCCQWHSRQLVNNLR